MSVIVHIWNNSADDVGHASLEIENKNTYISFWPKGSASAKGDIKLGDEHDSHYPSSYKVDLRLEGRHSDQQIRINKLNEDEMIEHWMNFKDNESKYNMKDLNCSTVVASFLEIGSGVSPSNSPRLSIASAVTNKFMRTILKLRFMGNYISMWSPNEVATYALQIKSDKTP